MCVLQRFLRLGQGKVGEQVRYLPNVLARVSLEKKTKKVGASTPTCADTKLRATLQAAREIGKKGGTWGSEMGLNDTVIGSAKRKLPIQSRRTLEGRGVEIRFPIHASLPLFSSRSR